MKVLLVAFFSIAIAVNPGSADDLDDPIKSRMRQMVGFLENGDGQKFIETYFHPIIVESLPEQNRVPDGAGMLELIAQLKIAVDLDLNPEFNHDGDIATFRYQEDLMSVGLMKYGDEWYLIFVNS